MQVGIENNRFLDISPFSFQVDVASPQRSDVEPLPRHDESFRGPVLTVTAAEVREGEKIYPNCPNIQNLVLFYQLGPDTFVDTFLIYGWRT